MSEVRYNDSTFTSIKPAYNDKKILNVENVSFFEAAKFMHTIHYHSNPDAFKDYFIPLSHIVTQLGPKIWLIILYLDQGLILANALLNIKASLFGVKYLINFKI